MTREFVCATCGIDLQNDGFIHGICPGCGGTNPIPRSLYDQAGGRQVAPSEHAPRKYAAYDPRSETFTVAEEESREAWVRADSGSVVEVRE